MGEQAGRGGEGREGERIRLGWWSRGEGEEGTGENKGRAPVSIVHRTSPPPKCVNPTLMMTAVSCDLA
jgi:hypothetical protein